MIEGSSKNVAAAQQDVKLSPLLLGGFAQKTFTKPGSKVTETLVLEQVVQPLLRSIWLSKRTRNNRGLGEEETARRIQATRKEIVEREELE